MKIYWRRTWGKKSFQVYSMMPPWSRPPTAAHARRVLAGATYPLSAAAGGRQRQELRRRLPRARKNCTQTWSNSPVPSAGPREASGYGPCGAAVSRYILPRLSPLYSDFRFLATAMLCASEEPVPFPAAADAEEHPLMPLDWHDAMRWCPCSDGLFVHVLLCATDMSICPCWHRHAGASVDRWGFPQSLW